MRSISVRLTVAATTAVLTWYAFFAIAQYFERTDAVFIASVLLGSVFLHELGHMIAFQRHGVSSYMFFAVILGGVVPLDGEKRLRDSAKMEVALAGMVGNVIAGLIGLSLALLGVLTADEAMRVVNINAALMVFNLLPFGFLDGGRAVKLLFDSVVERRDQAYVHGMTGVVLAAAGVTILIGNSQMLPAMLMVMGIRKRARDDDQHGHMKPTALNAAEQCFWARFYVFLAAVGMVATALTPDWL